MFLVADMRLYTLTCRLVGPSGGPSVRPSHFWIPSSFSSTAPAQPSATGLPYIRPWFYCTRKRKRLQFFCVLISVLVSVHYYNRFMHIHLFCFHSAFVNFPYTVLYTAGQLRTVGQEQWREKCLEFKNVMDGWTELPTNTAR